MTITIITSGTRAQAHTKKYWNQFEEKVGEEKGKGGGGEGLAQVKVKR